MIFFEIEWDKTGIAASQSNVKETFAAMIMRRLCFESDYFLPGG